VVSVLPAPPESLNAAAPAPLRILLDAIDRLGRLDGWIGGGCLLTLTALMLAEVATRLLSNFLPFFPPSISIAWEYSSYLMAASFTFGGSPINPIPVGIAIRKSDTELQSAVKQAVEQAVVKLGAPAPSGGGKKPAKKKG